MSPAAELLAYLQRYGVLSSERAEREGWTRGGLPMPPLRELVNRRIVAPRVLTSHPLRISWELRATQHDATQRAAVARLREQKKEYRWISSLRFW